MTETDVLLVETGQAVKSLDALAQETEKLKGKQKDLADFMKKDLEDAFLGAQAKYDLVKNTLSEVGQILKNSVSDYLGSIEVGMRHTLAMKNAGMESAIFKEKLEAQAQAIERLTGVQDEAVLEMQAMLMTMGVGKGDIERVTKAAYDMSVATGTSAANAARMLARASAEGKEELKKYGVTVRDTDGELEGFAATLEAVERKFGGISEQVPEQIQQINALKGAWNTFSEELGHALVSIGAGPAGSAGGWLTTALDSWSVALKNFADAPIEVTLGKLALITGGWANADVLFMKASSAADAVARAADAAKEAENAGKVNLGTLPAFNVSKEQKENEEAARKRTNEVVRAARFQSEMVFQLMKEMQDKQAAMDEEFRLQAAKDRAAEQAVMDEEREYEAAQGKSAHEDKLEREQEFWRRKLQIQERAQQEERERLQEAADFAKQIGSHLVQFGAGLLKEALLNDTAYTRAHKEQVLQQMTIGMKKEDADRKRAETEKMWAEENEANLKKKTADVLADIAVQAATKAVFATAEGIASAAGFNEASAAGFFAAAGMYAAIAVASGAGAYALSSGRGMTKDEKASLNNNQEAFERNRRQREAQQTAQAGGSVTQGTVVNVIHMGITGQTEVEQARELERIRNQYAASKTGGEI